MDRIYVRGFRCVDDRVPRGTAWARMSDHLPLVAELALSVGPASAMGALVAATSERAAASPGAASGARDRPAEGRRGAVRGAGAGDRRRARRGPARDLHLRVRRRAAARRRGARACRGAGVRVRVVVDGIGTGDVPRRVAARAGRRPACAGASTTRRAAGASCCRARWRRLHRKLCVVDGHVVFCGGINLIDDYRDPTHGKLDEPRFDFAVRVTGPLVADAHETMTRLWLRLQAAREARHFDFAKALRDGARRLRAPAPT